MRPIVGFGRARQLGGRTLLVVFAAVCVVTYVALPTALADTFFQVVAWGSIATFVYGIRRHARFNLAWTFIAIGWVSFALGDLTFSLYDHAFDIAPFPSVADVFYLAGYPFIAAGLAALVRRSRPAGDRIALIDASIVLVPMAVAAWIYLIAPYAAYGGSTFVERAVSGAYPLGDLLCLAVLVRLFAGSTSIRRHAQPATTIIGIGLVTMLVADVWFVVTQLHGTYVTGGFNDGLYIVPYIALAGTGMSRSVRNIGSEIPRTDPSLSNRRRLLLTISALVTPAILVIEWTMHGDLAIPLIVTGTAISFLLVIARMATLVEALEHSRAELAYDATHDVLTGLVNRGLFSRQVESVIEQGTDGALLFIDLDNFKRVNDRFGHPAGDDVLRRVADQLRMEVRDADVVARLAGDEFAVLLPGADSAAAHSLADRLVGRLSMTAGGDPTVTVTASIGTVNWQRNSTQTDDSLLAQADHAMYIAKAAMGNQFVVAG